MVPPGTCSRKSWTSPSSTGKSDTRPSSPCHTSTAKGKGVPRLLHRERWGRGREWSLPPQGGCSAAQGTQVANAPACSSCAAQSCRLTDFSGIAPFPSAQPPLAKPSPPAPDGPQWPCLSVIQASAAESPGQWHRGQAHPGVSDSVGAD